jgi:hypothetical protein
MIIGARMHMARAPAVLFGLIVSTVAAAYQPVAPPSVGQPMNNRLGGELANRMIQTGYFLEILSAQMCSGYVKEPHAAARDISYVVATLPDQLKKQPDVVDLIKRRIEQIKSYA